MFVLCLRPHHRHSEPDSEAIHLDAVSGFWASPWIAALRSQLSVIRHHAIDGDILPVLCCHLQIPDVAFGALATEGTL